MNVNLRRAIDADIPLIKEISEKTVWNSIPEHQRMILDKRSWSDHVRKVFENLIRKEDNEVFIAEDENQNFLGYIFVGKGVDMMTGQVHGFVYDIFVKEEYRNRGVGKVLLRKAESYCRERGYRRIGLMVSVENQQAIELYTRMGFRATHKFMEKELG